MANFTPCRFAHGGHLSGTHVFLDFVGNRLADIGDLAHVLGVEKGDIRGIAANGAGGLLVGACPVRVSARERYEVGVLLQQGFDLFVRPRHGASLGR
jgi:hypothetical protein